MQSHPDDSRPRVVVVERDPGVRALLARLLSHWGIDALAVSSDRAGARAVRENGSVALVVSDFRSGDGGPTVHDELRSLPGRPRFLCTRPTSADLPEDVVVVERPFEIDLLRETVLRLLDG